MLQCVKSKQSKVFIELLGKGKQVCLSFTQESQNVFSMEFLDLEKHSIWQSFSSDACPNTLCHCLSSMTDITTPPLIPNFSY